MSFKKDSVDLFILKSFINLRSYCEEQGFKGWDPYDGLNSKLFRFFSFFNSSSLCRLIVIQGFKRFPYNLRPLFIIPKEFNAKGIGLFLQGYCNLYNCIVKSPELANYLGSKDEILENVNKLAKLLISLRSEGYQGACWGYNFDWQARRLFLFPKNTPTVVATTFCATALMSAYEVTHNKEYLDVALSSSDFVINDLHRTKCYNGFLFSYSPLQGNDMVFNASLLGSKLLSCCYHYTGKEEYKEAARASVIACSNGQMEDGSWYYGLLPVQSWIDSFHTGYNLDAMITYQEKTKDYSFSDNIEKGFDFYIRNFFEKSGIPKYYHDKIYPIDIHCPGQLIVTLSRMHKFSQYKELMHNVLNWTVINMQDEKGYFYYQIKKRFSSKISYMRWSNAFMFNALSYYLLESVEND